MDIHPDIAGAAVLRDRKKARSRAYLDLHVRLFSCALSAALFLSFGAVPLYTLRFYAGAGGFCAGMLLPADTAVSRGIAIDGISCIPAFLRK